MEADYIFRTRGLPKTAVSGDVLCTEKKLKQNNAHTLQISCDNTGGVQVYRNLNTGEFDLKISPATGKTTQFSKVPFVVPKQSVKPQKFYFVG
jgi:hypothetical protein